MSAPKCECCAGRGWHVGECHPQEECGRCSGTGYADPELQSLVRRLVSERDEARTESMELRTTLHRITCVQNLYRAREQIDKLIIEKALVMYERNVTKAAAALGVSRPTLHSLIKHHDLMSKAKPGRPKDEVLKLGV